MRSLIEANESVEEWKESSRRMEKSRDSQLTHEIWSREKMYCDRSLKQDEEIEEGETKKLCPNVQKKIRTVDQIKERVQYLESQVKN